MPTRIVTPAFFALALAVLALSLLAPSLRSRGVTRLTQLKHHIYPSTSQAFKSSFTNPNRTRHTMAYDKELEVALLAVQRAAILTKAVYSSHSKGTLSKSDSSPVTIGDFGAQALIIAFDKACVP